MSVDIFVISWAGQHSNAQRIASSLSDAGRHVSIVYSDPDPDYVLDAVYPVERRSNELFWGDKFSACLERVRDDEPLVVIHADCHCADWQALVSRCETRMSNPVIGVWSPEIDAVRWSLERQTILPLGDDLLAVGRTDGIVFALSPGVIARMKQANYDDNVYGRGIETMFVVAAYARGMLAVVDRSVSVTHPIASGYSIEQAHEQMVQFLKQLGPRERVQMRLLNQNMRANGGRFTVPRDTPSDDH